MRVRTAEERRERRRRSLREPISLRPDAEGIRADVARRFPAGVLSVSERQRDEAVRHSRNHERRYLHSAILRGDLPVVQGTVLFGAFFIVMANLVVDIAYAFLDPRVRYT